MDRRPGGSKITRSRPDGGRVETDQLDTVVHGLIETLRCLLNLLKPCDVEGTLAVPRLSDIVYLPVHPGEPCG